MRFNIAEVRDRQEKLAIMRECDHAYTLSVLDRPFFPELFEKIDGRAVFLGVYSEAGERAGYSAFYANDAENRQAFLTLFCIRRSMQRMHLGEALMRESLAAAKAHGMTAMALEVLKRDTGAIAFYERFGFRPTGRETEQFVTMRAPL